MLSFAQISDNPFQGGKRILGRLLALLESQPLAAGSTRFYQTYYRDPVAYACAATFNVTGGVGVIWAP